MSNKQNDELKEYIFDTQTPEEVKLDEVLELLKELKEKVDTLSLEH